MSVRKYFGVILSILLLLVVASCGGSDTPTKVKEPTQAELIVKQIDNGALRLDVSKVEDIVTFMNRAPDMIERESVGTGRRLSYKFPDGSTLIYSMKPAAAGQGLLLNYYMIGDE